MSESGDLQAKLECPLGVEEREWAESLGMTVGQWREKLEKARRGERGMINATGALLALREGAAEEIGEAVASGGKLGDLAVRYGMSGGALRAWIFGDAERLAAYENGLRGRAEALADEALEYRDDALKIADGAEVETVAVSKLQVDTRFKAAGLNMQLAAKYDARRFGEDRSMKLEVGGRDEGALLEQLKELTREPEMREMLRMLLSEGATVIEGDVMNDGAEHRG